jgi:hypothetical protein
VTGQGFPVLGLTGKNHGDDIMTGAFWLPEAAPVHASVLKRLSRAVVIE